MKYFIIISAILLIAGFLIFGNKNNESLPTISIYFKELPKFFNALKSSNNSESFLILTLSETEKFIQFKFIDEQFEIDFPVVTDAQKRDEKKIISVCKELGLDIKENPSTNENDYFLDIYLRRDVNSISKTVEELFTKIYSAKENSALIASYNDIKI